MRKIVNICLLFLFIPILIFSSTITDSLQTLIETSSDKDKIDIYLNLAEITQTSSFEDAKNYVNIANELAEKTDDPNDNILTLLTLAEIKQNNGNYIETYNILQFS